MTAVAAVRRRERAKTVRGPRAPSSPPQPSTVLGAILELVAVGSPLQSLVLCDTRAGRVRSLEWHARGVRGAEARAAKARAVVAYRYLTGTLPSPQAPEASATAGALIVLPVIGEQGDVIGVVQLDAPSSADEGDRLGLNRLRLAERVAARVGVLLGATYDWENAVRGRDRAEWLARARAALLIREEKRRASAEAKEGFVAFLADASAVLGGTLDYVRAIEAVARAAVPRIADACVIDLVLGDGRTLRIAHAPALADDVLAGALHDVVRSVLATNQPARARRSGLEEARRALGAARVVCVPMARHGEARGAMTFVVDTIAEGSVDVPLAAALAHRVAAAAHNGCLYENVTGAVARGDEVRDAVAHDVKNLANLAGLKAQLAITDVATGTLSADRRQLDAIVQAARAIAVAMDELSSANGVDGNAMDPRACLPAALAASACTLSEPMARAKGVALGHDVSASLPLVVADAGHIARVLANVIGNAVAYTPSGGAVAVHAVSAGDEVIFAVMDTGVGIAAEDLPRIFERGWQDAAHERRGHGLGLWIARRLVSAHGGRIWAESGLRVGTTVRFSLPVVTADRQRLD